MNKIPLTAKEAKLLAKKIYNQVRTYWDEESTWLDIDKLLKEVRSEIASQNS